jgi:hypothetical protein
VKSSGSGKVEKTTDSMRCGRVKLHFEGTVNKTVDIKRCCRVKGSGRDTLLFPITLEGGHGR